MPKRAMVVLVGRGRLGREPRARPAGGPTAPRPDAGLQLPQRPHARPHPHRSTPDVEAHRAEMAPSSTNSRASSSRPGSRRSVRLGRRPPPHRARPRQPARRPIAADDLERVRQLFDDLETQDGRDRALGRRRERAGRAHLHRLGEQALFALGLLGDRSALQGRERKGRRRARRHRPDAAQLCPHRAGGRLHGARGEPDLEGGR